MILLQLQKAVTKQLEGIAKLAINTLRFGAKNYFNNIELCINGWSMKKVESYLTGRTDLQDTLQEDMKEVFHVDSEKYLGQFLSSDSKNTININYLRNKGIGIQNKIIQMLDKMPEGVFHFEIAEFLRNMVWIDTVRNRSTQTNRRNVVKKCFLFL